MTNTTKPPEPRPCSIDGLTVKKGMSCFCGENLQNGCVSEVDAEGRKIIKKKGR